jgi:carbonic anhydrase
LGQNQTPKYLYFGCSDSRVPANEILGLGPGEVFVHRNVGNLVPGNDLNALSVLEFAVEHLGVTDIIVTGHYNCGACKAAVTRQDLGMLENWLRLIRDVYRLHREYLDSIPSEEERHKKLVELNVVEQCVNIFKTGTSTINIRLYCISNTLPFVIVGVVQRKRLKNKAAHSSNKDLANAPRNHGLVFDTSDGVLSRLNVDYSRVGSLESIYALY